MSLKKDRTRTPKIIILIFLLSLISYLLILLSAHLYKLERFEELTQILFPLAIFGGVCVIFFIVGYFFFQSPR